MAASELPVKVNDDGNLQVYTLNMYRTQITITVTCNPAIVDTWVTATCYHHRYRLNRLVVGLGVQWTKQTPASTLQLCVGRHCLIYQLSHTHYIPNSLRHFLATPTTTFVGLHNFQDSHRLFISPHCIQLSMFPLDMRFFLTSDSGESLVDASFGDIAREVLGFRGVRLNYKISSSDWDALFLSRHQIRYACLRAYVSFLLGLGIGAWRF